MTSAKTIEPSPARPPVKGQRMQAFWRSVGMLPILILICVMFQFLSGWSETGNLSQAFQSGRFATALNLSTVAQQAAVNTVLAAGMTFVILTGGIDLSVGSILAVGAMAALIISKIPDWGMLGILAGVLTGLVFGLINGTLISAMRLPPFIVTLGSLTAVRGVARLLGDDTTVFNSDLPFAAIGNGGFVIPGTGYNVSWLVVIAIVVIAISWFILRRTVLGVHIYAVGGNADAARLAGIKVWAVLLFVYGVSGLLAGLGGVMQASRLYAANGLQLGTSYELDAIAAVILGGTSFVGGVGSIVGTLIGALIIAVLANGLILTGVSDVWQFIIKGLVIIGAVALDRYRMQGNART
ncbi:ABC transporter permease subunit [Lichenihabitans sp. PAMC28606]|uniref:ABC transporter permease subunit n=1 Tax=Lichenihabitans sp. PAMC28606 TaxID=2880932 RepID=UPI0039B3D878